jgi:hypothetical protein
MWASSQATSALLRTIHGNAVYFEPDKSRLAHGSGSLEGNEIRLAVDAAGCRQTVGGRHGARGVRMAPGDAGCRLVPLERATCFTLVEDHGGPLGVFNRGAALHTSQDGTLHLRRGPLNEDALFFAVTEQAMRCACALREDRWVDCTTGHIHAPGAVMPGQWHLLAIAGRVVSIVGTRDPFVTDSIPGAPVHRLHVILPDGGILPLARYRPLIYFAVYGPDRYFACLSLALQSIFRHGAFDGTVCIASDRGRDEVAPFVPDAFAGRWIHRDITADAGLFARYDCLDWGLEAFSPVLYMDTDVIINAPLAPLLTPLAGSRRVHAGTSDRLAPHLAGKAWRAHASDLADWFGNWLFGNDPRLADQPFAMGGSGIIGFATMGDAQLAFDTVRALRRHVRPELLAYFGDQPLFNYALHVLGCGNFTTLETCIDLARHIGECGEARRGLMHFHAGVGNVEVKHEAMLHYMARLDAAGEAAAGAAAMVNSYAEDARPAAVPLPI